MPKSAKSSGGVQSLNDDGIEINPAHREENEAYIYNSVAVLIGEFMEIIPILIIMSYFSIGICWDDYLCYFLHSRPSN